MNVYININDFKIDNVFFYTPIKNTMLINSNYIKIIYSTKDFTLNSIHIIIPNNLNINLYNYYKDKITYIENELLNKYSNKKQLNTILHNIKNNKDCILKISGIWENKTECGLIYKYIYPSVL